MIPSLQLPRLIALSGWRGSGKDTTADYLIAEYGYQKISFAAPLKDMVSILYDVPREDLDSPTKKEMPLVNLPVIPTDPFTATVINLLSNELKSGFWTPRALCILEGSVKRSVYSNYWVKNAAKQILSREDGLYVISDMRYQSEADTLKLLVPDVVTIRVNRFETIETKDPSERNLDSYAFNHTISNTGTRELLYTSVDGILDGYIHGRRPTSN